MISKIQIYLEELGVCGRFLIESSIEDIFKYYGISMNEKGSIEPGEKFPGVKQPVITGGDELKLKSFKWGFKIYGSKEIINARIETVNQKTSFKGILHTKRCIVPANAFYEWRGVGKNKIKYRISLENEPLFSMAALFNNFVSEKNESYNGFVILTKPANKRMQDIHTRMPLILDKCQENEWLGNYKYYEASLNRLIQDNSEHSLKIESVESVIQTNFFYSI